MAYLLGIDLATNGVTALLLDPGKSVVGRAFAGYPTQQPRPGWVEQAPEQWWLAAKDAIRRLLIEAEVSGHDVSAIGLSGQMHGTVLVDERGRPVRPAIIWSDRRGEEQIAWMLGQADAREWVTWTGARPLIGMSGPRLLWVKQEEPDVFARAHKVLAPKDYLRLCLTGEFATDVTDASSTLLFDVPARVWSRESRALMGISSDLLPECYESQAISGSVSLEVAEETGLKAGTPVVAGAGNQAAAAMGLGVVRTNEVAAILGSGGVIIASIDEPLIDKDLRLQTFCHARRTKWYMVGMTQTAGMAFRWMRDPFCNAEKEAARSIWDDAYNLMTRQAEELPIGSNGLLFLPYLNGERTPYMDPTARGVFFGITAQHEKRHFIRAVMEGVTFSMRDCLEVVKQTGVSVDRVVVAGGGLNNPVWRHIFADALGVDLVQTNVVDPAPFGAALMASVAAGMYSSVEQACEEIVQVTEFTEPNPENVARYNELYEIYRGLYPALCPAYGQMATFLEGQAEVALPR
ncbi:MAG TPA: xylulokinase [Armatimonadota bacterium]|jgi:xylulokinase